MDAGGAMRVIPTARIAKSEDSARASVCQKHNRLRGEPRGPAKGGESSHAPSIQMNQDSWLLLECGPNDHAFNMALDEALLEAMPRLEKPVLRFYAWREPAASSG